MKSLTNNFCTLLDITGVLALLVAAGCLIYAIKIPELSLAEQYFSNFFSLLWGAVSLFLISRSCQFLLLMLTSGMQNARRKSETAVYQTAKSVR